VVLPVPGAVAVRIRREDVEHVRENTRVEEIVGEYVTLKTAGVGSLRGLCPFHDERTPSFHVRPPVGRWHCFGCGEDGDVISFVQKIDQLTFTEAVERLAARLGHQLRYEDESGAPASARRDQVGQRQRLLEANRVAAEFFAEQLATSEEAGIGRQFLFDREFDQAAAEQFSVGFAPRAGETLLRFLRGKGFTEEELLASGLAGRGQRGLYDRFRGRLMWPIRDVTGAVVGFGARRLFDDDRIDAKYLNTPETTLYRKSQVLYGVDLAKREISRSRTAVVVEGYTDVMACHLSGVTTAVATCGTAFGADHVRILRRLLGDDSSRAGKVVFTFDGDEAGRKAAMRAFADDQRFVAQTYVAVARDGMDPCDLRIARGTDAVRDLVTTGQPMFRFAIRSGLAEIDLDTAEGRAQGLRQAAPVVARIRDIAVRADYARQLAGWLSLPVEDVLQRVRAAQRQSAGDTRPPSGRGAPEPEPERSRPVAALGFDPRDPVARVERETLACLIQVPHLVPVADVDAFGEHAFDLPAFRAVHLAIRAAGGLARARELDPRAWAEAVLAEAPATVVPVVSELAVVPLPTGSEEELARYAATVVLKVAETEATRQLGNLRSKVQLMEPDHPEYQSTYAELFAVESRRRSLQERMQLGG
jgi:DNA primase